MHISRRGRAAAAIVLSGSIALSGAAAWAAPGDGGGGEAGTGSIYSDLVVALRAQDGTPLLKEYQVTDEQGTTIEYCVQPVAYDPVPGVTATTNPLDGRQVWVLPLQGEWIDHPVDPLPVEEIEACDPQPQYAMFVGEAELERLNLTRTSESVLAQKIQDVRTKLVSADVVGLDPAGRLTVDGVALDAAPEHAAMYESLMTTGTIPGLDPADVPYGPWQLAAVSLGAAASKSVPITVDTVQYYNRIVGFPALDPPPSWGDLRLISSQDPDETTPMPVDVPPGGEDFVDYSGFTYNRAATFVGSVTWLDVAGLAWHVDKILDAVPWTNLRDTTGLTKAQVDGRTLTGATAFAQMADDARAVINYLHEHEVVLPGFMMDPVLVDTTQAQQDAITHPAVQATAPEQVFRTLPFQATGSVFNPWGGNLVDEGRVRVTVDAPAALGATDVTMSVGGVEVALTPNGAGDLVGWWGPPEGTAMPPGYRSVTTFDVLVGGAAPTGATTMTFDLVDVDDPAAVLATDSATFGVNADATTVLWGGELPVLGVQGSYLAVPVRVYAPGAQDATLTFALTGPGDDPGTDLLEELEAGDARVYASNGSDMVPMDLSLTGQDLITGTWSASLEQGYNDLVWYLLVNEGAPIGHYGVDVGIQGATDLAEPQYVSFSAPEQHGQQPPDAGEDTTAPLVKITVDALTADSVSLSFTANEQAVTFKTQLTVDGVKGPWEDTVSGVKSYTGLAAGDYVFAVKATDAAGNTATYIKKFVVAAVAPTPGTTPTPGTPTPAPAALPDTWVTAGPDDLAWVLGREASFVLGSDLDPVTFQVVVNGHRRADAGRSLTVSRLRSGVNRLQFRAVGAQGVDPTPVVRTVFVPFGVKDLKRSGGWSVRKSPDALFGKAVVTRLKDRSLHLYAHHARRIALVVTTTPDSGKVWVYAGGKRLTTEPIDLRGATTTYSRLIQVAQLAAPVTGHVRLVSAGGGEVRIEGVALADR